MYTYFINTIEEEYAEYNHEHLCSYYRKICYLYTWNKKKTSISKQNRRLDNLFLFWSWLKFFKFIPTPDPELHQVRLEMMDWKPVQWKDI